MGSNDSVVDVWIAPDRCAGVVPGLCHPPRRPSARGPGTGRLNSSILSGSPRRWKSLPPKGEGRSVNTPGLGPIPPAAPPGQARMGKSHRGGTENPALGPRAAQNPPFGVPPSPPAEYPPVDGRRGGWRGGSGEGSRRTSPGRAPGVGEGEGVAAGAGVGVGVAEVDL